MTPSRRTELVRRLAAEQGLPWLGIAPATPIERSDYVRRWLAQGQAGSMSYLERHANLREDPRRLLPGARSIIVVAEPYRHATAPDPPPADDRPRGRIARYAWGRDYHRVLRKKLQRLADAIADELEEPFDSRECVDTAPLIEREIAARTPIGWIGKNTMVLNRDLGSYFFLGEILTTLELSCDPPGTDHCGTCTRCLDACPTGALTEPYRMDASRCIAYLTIERRSDPPLDLVPGIGDWVFGCDICQEVCPYNRAPSASADPAYDLQERNPLPPRPPLHDVMNITDEQYRTWLAGSAMKRATPDMLRRNASIALVNARQPAPPTPRQQDERTE